MRVTRVGDGETATYEVGGLTANDAGVLAALADFPLWSEQPKEVAELCAALHTYLELAITGDVPVYADARGMVPTTTV